MKVFKHFAAVVLAAALAMTLTAGQEASQPTVQIAPGGYLADAEGRSLYIYLRDAPGLSVCEEECVENWPAFTTEGEPVAGENVRSQMLGTIEREDGSSQVTYNEWPLYYHARDTGPGDVIGHRLGNIFYLIGTTGERVRGEAEVEAQDEEEEADPVAEEAQDDAEGEQAEDDGEQAAQDQADEQQADDEQAQTAQPALFAQGQDVFANQCAVCHGSEGRGNVGPGLVGNATVESVNSLLNTIIHGRPDHGMPAFGNQLSDEQIAAVATFVRNAWENDFGPVGPEQVSEQR